MTMLIVWASGWRYASMSDYITRSTRPSWFSRVCWKMWEGLGMKLVVVYVATTNNEGSTPKWWNRGSWKLSCITCHTLQSGKQPERRRHWEWQGCQRNWVTNWYSTWLISVAKTDLHTFGCPQRVHKCILTQSNKSSSRPDTACPPQFWPWWSKCMHFSCKSFLEEESVLLFAIHYEDGTYLYILNCLLSPYCLTILHVYSVWTSFKFTWSCL